MYFVESSKQTDESYVNCFYCTSYERLVLVVVMSWYVRERLWSLGPGDLTNQRPEWHYLTNERPDAVLTPWTWPGAGALTCP